MSSTYEKTSMDNTEMSKLIEAAKQQSSERSKKEVEKRKKMVVSTNTSSTTVVSNQTDMKSVEHGEYVKTEDGMGAIVIDHEVELEKRRSNDKTGEALLNLLNPNGLIIDANQYVPDYGKDAPEGYDPGVQFITENPYDPKTKKIKEIKDGFSKLSLGLPGQGLVNSESDEAKIVAEALHKLETGEIVLPTPEEYEKQKEEARKNRDHKRAERQAKAKEALRQQNARNDIKEEQIVEMEEPQMAEMPENAVIKKGVDELMSTLDTETNNNQVTPDTPVKVETQIETPTKIEEKIVEPIENPTSNTTTQTNVPSEPVAQPDTQPVQAAPQKPTTFNLAEAEEEVKEITESAPEEKKEEEIKPEDVVHIDVPSGEAETLIDSLPVETYEKVVKSKVIKVNEVELKDIPVATSRITNIADYKRVSRRRKNVNTAEITERVLINSGFVITLKGATSLEMATIFVSPTASDVDYEKEYTFCYEHTVGTSIGKLSYNEFVAKVDPMDLETILYGIYEISETDERNVSIICGTNDGGCGESYEVGVKVSELPDLDTVTDETKERIKTIVDAKNSIDVTRRIVEESPTSIVKVIKLGDRFLTIRTTTGNMMIERMDMVESIGQTYGPLIAILILYVESITLQIQERPDVEPTPYLLDTVELICEELVHFNDDELECVKDIISELKQYRTISFSIKGPCVCPNCRNVKKSIPCAISDLVFQKAQNVLV